MNRRNLSVIVAIVVIVLVTIGAIVFARGYRLDITQKDLVSTGILVTTSDPDGAEVIIDGKLTTATNSTVNLKPGKYNIKLHKEGFSPWEKLVEIKPEEVIKTNAFLFPVLADLRPLTLSGSLNPTVSSDGSKITFGVASASAQKIDGNGLWFVDLGRNFPAAPFLSPGDFRQIFRNSVDLKLSDALLTWSPDHRQIVASGSAGLTYLLETDRINLEPTLLSPSQTAKTLGDWQEQIEQRKNGLLLKLPLDLSDKLATGASDLSFSPDETKILYVATSSASLPSYLSSYLPGTNPTPQTRELKPGNTYVYDLKEDRNYLVKSDKLGSDRISWFPSSRHLLAVSSNQIAITEFDGTNRAVIFSGQFNPGFVVAWPNWSKIVILTSLGNPAGQENLYTINLR